MNRIAHNRTRLNPGPKIVLPDDVPDLRVTPPAYVFLTEGYDPEEARQATVKHRETWEQEYQSQWEEA